jgi:hypothetical protein
LSLRGSLSPVRQPGAWSISQIMVPDSVTDASRHRLCLDRFFHPSSLMQPREQDLNSLDANGKVWAMDRQPFSKPVDGPTWSFADHCHAGITEELKKVLYFFEIVNGMSNHFHWNGFAVGASDIEGCNGYTSLKPTLAPNGKDVIGVMLHKYMESDEAISFRGASRGVDTSKLLSASEHSSSGTVHTPMPLFRISLNFTAAVFESNRVRRKARTAEQGDHDSGSTSDDEEEQRQAIFGVVTVTTLRNVDSLRLILVILSLLFFLFVIYFLMRWCLILN